MKSIRKDWSLRFLLAGISLVLALSLQGAETVTVCSFNTHNFLAPDLPGNQTKSPAQRQLFIQALADIDADICILLETGGEPVAREINRGLKAFGKDYPFHSVVEAADENRKILLFSRIKPKKLEHKTDAFYKIGSTVLPVRRGFANCLFEWDNGYQLRILAAHLKSKRYHKLGQTDMRRYESRQLRYLADEYVLKEDDCNLLVVGDFNDSPASSPLNTLFNRRRKETDQLYDLRPVDQYGMAWTHFWMKEDLYSRIDYALASQALLPEVDFSANRIHHFPNMFEVSDHRPVIIRVRLKNQPVTPDVLAPFKRNIYRPIDSLP